MGILIIIGIMPYRSDEDYDPQSNFFEDENRRRQLEHDNHFLNTAAGQNFIRYNDARNFEIEQQRNEQLNWIKSFYFSQKILIIIVLSVLISLTKPGYMSFIEAFIGANFFIFIALLIIAKIKPTNTTVRPPISKDTAIRETARQKAYRR